MVHAWELGNELHTPTQPDALIPFISADVALVRSLDPLTPILPGTMGANHVQPGQPESPHVPGVRKIPWLCRELGRGRSPYRQDAGRRARGAARSAESGRASCRERV